LMGRILVDFARSRGYQKRGGGARDVTLEEGLMGAQDAKLGCHVALKVLPQAFATHADRMTRFQREAQVLDRVDLPVHGA